MLATSPKQKDFLWSVIPNLKDHTDLKLIYRASRDGWAKEVFHKLCDNQGPTIVMARSSVGRRVSGGFTSVPWTSEGGWKQDQTAFLFSVDSELKFPIVIKSQAVYHHAHGPYFTGCFCLQNMNLKNESYCYFEGSGKVDESSYNVSDDGKGNSILTGEGGKEGKFTCSEMEVFAVIYT